MVVTGRLWPIVALGVLGLWLPGGGWWIVGACALGLLAALVDLLSCGRCRDIRIQRVPTDPIARGADTALRLQVTNTSRRFWQGQLRDAWQPSVGIVQADRVHDISLAPGESVQVTSRCQPTRRGLLTAHHVAVRRLGPLRVAGRQRTMQVTGGVLVLPAFRSRRHVPAMLKRLRWVEGQVAVRLRGQGTEFDSLRDYVKGDDVRSVDWRATARRQHLTVKTWRPEQDRRILLVLDLGRTSSVRIGDEPRLDAAMDAALLLCAVTQAAGDRVDVVGIDTSPRLSVTDVGRSVKVGGLLREMATIEPTLIDVDWSAVGRHIARRAKHHALVVLLTSVDAGTAASGLLPLASRLLKQHTVVVAAVTDNELHDMTQQVQTSADAMTAAAAQRELFVADAVTRELAASGVRTLLGTSEELPRALVHCYLELKLRGQL